MSIHPGRRVRLAAVRVLIGTTIGLGCLLLMAGCASYRAQPIDPEAVAAAWRAIDARAASEAVQAAMEPALDAGEDGLFDLADGINRREAEATALFFNPSIRATRLQIGIPLAEARHARLWEDPELEVDGAYILEDVDEPLVLGSGIAITIPLSGRPGVARKLAEARIEAAEAAALGAEWALVSSLRQDWLRLAALDARIALLEASIAEIRQLVELTPRFRAAQAVTVVDERLLLIQQRRAEDALNRALAERGQQRLVVLATLGLHPGHDWRLEASLDALPVDPSPNGREELLRHPQLRRVLAAYQVAERRLQLEVRKQYPDLRIGLGGGTEEGESRILFGLGLLPIPIWNANREGIATAEVDRSVAATEIESAIQDLTHRFVLARQQERALAARLAFLDQELAPLVDQQVQDTRRLTGLGQLDLILLADALQQAREIRLELLDARIEVLAARLVLNALAGPPLQPDEPSANPAEFEP